MCYIKNTTDLALKHRFSKLIETFKYLNLQRRFIIIKYYNLLVVSVLVPVVGVTSVPEKVKTLY